MHGFSGRWWAGLRHWRVLTRQQTRRREVDRADMGITSGLDASFEPLEPARPTVEAVGAAPLPSWEDRLVRRSGL